MSLNQSFHAALVAVLYLVKTTLTTTCNKKLECLKQLETYSVVLKWHTCCPVKYFTHVAPAVHLYSSNNISVLIMRLGFFFNLLLGVLCLFCQNIVRTLINGTIIKVYKYVYKYNRVIALSGCGRLVIQPAVQAITLCWLG